MLTSDSKYDHHRGCLENVISQAACQVGPSDWFIFVTIVTSDSQHGHHGSFLENVISQTASQVGPSDVFIFVQMMTSDRQYDHHGGYLKILPPKPLVRLGHQMGSYLFQ